MLVHLPLLDSCLVVTDGEGATAAASLYHLADEVLLSLTDRDTLYIVNPTVKRVEFTDEASGRVVRH